jgi:hypothetical protein
MSVRIIRFHFECAASCRNRFDIPLDIDRGLGKAPQIIWKAWPKPGKPLPKLYGERAIPLE